MKPLEDASAIILCGGRSLRAGFDKQTLRVGGRLIALHLARELSPLFRRICLVTSRPELYPSGGPEVLTDRFPGGGPLAGLHAGLLHSGTSLNYLIACDMPFPDLSFIRWMARRLESRPEAEGAVVLDRELRPEPFNGFYRSRCLPRAERLLEEGRRSLSLLCREGDMVGISCQEAEVFSPGGRMFTNLNTREDMLLHLGARALPLEAGPGCSGGSGEPDRDAS